MQHRWYAVGAGNAEHIRIVGARTSLRWRSKDTRYRRRKDGDHDMAVGVGRAMVRGVAVATVLCYKASSRSPAVQDVERMRNRYNRQNNRHDEYCCECGRARTQTGGWTFRMHTYDEDTDLHTYEIYWLCADCGSKSMDIIRTMRADAKKEYADMLNRTRSKDSFTYNLIEDTMRGLNEQDRI